MGLFGGSKSTTSSAKGYAGPATIDASGWVVGKGNARGGRTASSMAGLPWYAWAGVAIAAVWIIRKKGVHRGK